MVVFSPLNDFILITQFKDDFKKKQKNFHPLIMCSLDCRFFNCNYWVKALLNDFILITQVKDESFQNKTKKSKILKKKFPDQDRFSLTFSKKLIFTDL